MAMPPGNVIRSDKFPFPVAAGHWIADERDGFISWLRSEFAAANAIIDSLCHHLRSVGDPGEYDSAISAIHQRRINWTPVLLMQQYFPVADVVYTLEQVAWKKQQQQQIGLPVDHQGKFVGKEFRRSGIGIHKHDRSEKSQEAKSGGGKMGKIMEDKGLSAEDGSKKGTGTDANTKHSADSSSKSWEDSEALAVGSVENQPGRVNSKGTSNSKDNKSACDHNQNEKLNFSITPKTFVATEIYDGKPVNVVDGLKLYKELLNSKEVAKLASMINDLRVSGKRGQLQGQAYVVYKRPMKGHGREMIQLGLPIADAPLDDEIPTDNSKDQRVETIPAPLQDVIECLVSGQIMPLKPDSCIIDFYNEGDHSQPNMFVPWFGRPVCLMFLSECDMTFGRVIVSDHPGDFKGSLKLSLTPGSFLVMQGKSADFSKHAINSIRKQRTIITFTKCIPRRSLPGLSQSSLVPPSGRPPPSRSPNHTRHPSGATKNYTGVLPTPPPLRPQIPPPNGIQPFFVPASITPAMPFPAPPVPIPPGPTRWPAQPPPRQPPPMIASPGTGVFLPPSGSGNPPSTEAGLPQEKENGLGKSDNGDCTYSEDKLDEVMEREGCNGQVAEKEEEKVDGKQSS